VLSTSRSASLLALSPPVKPFSDEFADVVLANIGCLSDDCGGSLPLVVKGLPCSETAFISGTLSLPAPILSVKGAISDNFAGVNFYTGWLFRKLLGLGRVPSKKSSIEFLRICPFGRNRCRFLTTDEFY
jgi:hypothetical protein